MTRHNLADRGTRTLHTRVERWECDFNNHWNVRFYARSFQMASESLAFRETGRNPGAGAVATRHIRFHKELFANAPVVIRSARVGDGAFEGAVVHLAISEGKLAATSLEQGATRGESLPVIASDSLSSALPRGIDTAPVNTEWSAGSGDQTLELGPVRPAELDHTGGLLTEDILKRVALASHHQLAAVGYTPEFVQETGVSRMSVENRAVRHGDPKAGDMVHARSRIIHVGEKVFNVQYHLFVPDGPALATVEQCFVAVDLKSRRGVAAPAFLRAAMPAAAS